MNCSKRETAARAKNRLTPRIRAQEGMCCLDKSNSATSDAGGIFDSTIPSIGRRISSTLKLKGSGSRNPFGKEMFSRRIAPSIKAISCSQTAMASFNDGPPENRNSAVVCSPKPLIEKRLWSRVFAGVKRILFLQLGRMYLLRDAKVLIPYRVVVPFVNRSQSS